MNICGKGKQDTNQTKLAPTHFLYLITTCCYDVEYQFNLRVFSMNKALLLIKGRHTLLLRDRYLSNSLLTNTQEYLMHQLAK